MMRSFHLKSIQNEHYKSQRLHGCFFKTPREKPFFVYIRYNSKYTIYTSGILFFVTAEKKKMKLKSCTRMM